MRADAKKNYDHLLEVAHQVISEHGAEASMRDIARRAEVGLATLLRHFPTREALFEALLRLNAEALTRQAVELEASDSPDEALVAWFRAGVAFTHIYSGVCDFLANAHNDPDSALYALSSALRSAGERLLQRSQVEGSARADMDGVDLFALMSALAWTVGQPGFVAREEHLFDLITSAILTRRPDGNRS